MTRVNELLKQMTALGDTISKARVVGKILRSMGAKYNHVVTTIEKSRDITNLTLDDIKSNERVQDYVTRFNELVNQMTALGETILEAMVVGKVLRSMGTKYNHVVTAIEESRDITYLTLDDITGSFQAHESRLISQDDQVKEKVLLVQ